LRRDLRQADAQLLAHAAFGAIAADGFAECAGNRKTDARSEAMFAFDCKKKRREVRAAQALPVFINPAEVRGAENARAFRQPEAT